MNKKQKQLVPFNKIIFLFLEQSNKEWRMTINPDYLNFFRATQGISPIESKLMYELNRETWGRIKGLLANMSDADKKALLKREWEKHPISNIKSEGIPENLEKTFLKALKNPEIINLNK